MNLVLTRFNILKSGGTSKNNEYRNMSNNTTKRSWSSSTADSPHTNSHRHTGNLYILTAHPPTGRLQSNSKPSRLLPSQDG